MVKRLLLIISLLSLLSSNSWATNWCSSATGCWLYAEGSGTTVEDSSPNSNTGTFKADGEPAWVGSVTGTNAPAYASDCVDNDGVDDYVSYGTGMDDVSPFSYVIWYKPDSAASGDYLYFSSATDGGGGSASMYVGFATTYDLTFYVFNTSSSAFATLAANDVVTNATDWWHIAVSWDGTTNESGGALYVNGIAVDETVATNGGTRRSDSTFYKYLPKTANGKITENAIFSSALSATDINNIMDNGLVQSGGTPLILRRRSYLID